MKVVFLDRDGVINEFPGSGAYVTKVKDFRFLPGAIDAIRLLTDAGYTIFVVSNQAGVGKGVYSLDKLQRITRRMMQEIRKNGGDIKRVFYCTHRVEEGCDCRKPNIGFIHKAMDVLDKTIRTAKNAYFVGDTKADIMTGHNAGCKTIFVLSGRETRNHLRGWPVKPDFIAPDLWQAARIITRKSTPSRPAKTPPSLKSAAPL